MSAAEVRTVRLSKWYGKVTALQDVSLLLEAGIWGLLGPNGSGKSTFLNTVAGQIRPSLGTVTVCGESPFANPKALARIGLCPEADAMYDELTGLEHVAACAELSGFSPTESLKRAAEALDAFGLTEEARARRVGGYSRGMRQRTKLAQAVVHDPDVLLLDEPLTGTDPTSRAIILQQLKARADAGAVVIFSTHVLHEVETLTDNVLLIARGQVVAQGRAGEIRDLLEDHPHHIRVECDDPRGLAASMLGFESVAGVTFPEAGVVEFETHLPEETYSALTRVAVNQGFVVRSLTSPDASLEALFHYLVDHSGKMAGTGADAAVGASSPRAYKSQLSGGSS